MILEFPWGVLLAIEGCIRRQKYRKTRGQPHVNRIQPEHISRLLNVKKIKIDRGGHTWCRGRKGKILRKIIGNRELYSSAWKDWHIEATKNRLIPRMERE